jgi:hypothetical protein
LRPWGKAGADCAAGGVPLISLLSTSSPSPQLGEVVGNINTLMAFKSQLPMNE